MFVNANTQNLAFSSSRQGDRFKQLHAARGPAQGPPSSAELERAASCAASQRVDWNEVATNLMSNKMAVQQRASMRSFLIRDILSGDEDEEEGEIEIDVDSDDPATSEHQVKHQRDQQDHHPEHHPKHQHQHQQQHEHHDDHDHDHDDDDHDDALKQREATCSATLNDTGNSQFSGHQQMHAFNSPLEALFQMTSSTFNTLKRGEKRKGKFWARSIL